MSKVNVAKLIEEQRQLTSTDCSGLSTQHRFPPNQARRSHPTLHTAPFFSSHPRLLGEYGIVSKTPGPGAYNLLAPSGPREQLSKIKIPLGGLCSRKIMPAAQHKTPGPGHYNPKDHEGPKQKPRPRPFMPCMKVERFQEAAGSKDLGPGCYEVPMSPGKGFTYVFREGQSQPRARPKLTQLQEMIQQLTPEECITLTSNTNECLPLPQPQPRRDRSPPRPKHTQDFLKHRSVIQDLFYPEENCTPGPGAYEVSLPELKPRYLQFKNSPSFVYSEQPNQLQTTVPGPGHYRPQDRETWVRNESVLSSGFSSLVERSVPAQNDWKASLTPLPRFESKSFNLNLLKHWL